MNASTNQPFHCFGMFWNFNGFSRIQEIPLNTVKAVRASDSPLATTRNYTRLNESFPGMVSGPNLAENFEVEQHAIMNNGRNE